MKLPIALQLYSIRNETEKDMFGALEKVAGMGYKGVEFVGFGGIPAPRMKAELDRLGLKAVASHTDIRLLRERLDQEIEYNLEIGSKYIICPFNKYESREDYTQTARILDETGKKCRAAGLRLAYHNHNFEFETYEGEYGLDILYGNSKPEYLLAEIDSGWAFYAGVDPAEYICRYTGRCPLIHIKDFLTRGERTFTEIGNGIIDLAAIIKAAEAAGTEWLIVEQDESSRPMLESVKIGFDNLSKLVNQL